MVKKKVNHCLKISNEIIPKKDVTKFFKDLLYAYEKQQNNKIEISKIISKREIILEEMELKHQFYNKIFIEIFSERKKSIDKIFKIIDRGVETNNRELISSGLSALSQIVSTSPFSDLENLTNLLESNRTIEF